MGIGTALQAMCFAVVLLGSSNASGKGNPASGSPSTQWSPFELPVGAEPAVVRAEFHLLDVEKINEDD